MVINEDNIENIDLIKEKARAIIIDKENNVLVSEIEGSFLFPGGTVDPGEDYHETIKREIKEEAGIAIDDFEELVTIKYYHKDMPNLKEGGSSNRLNIVHYFYKRVDIIDVGRTHLTDFEKKYVMKIKKCSFTEIKNKVNQSSNYRYRKFTNCEMRAILKYLESKNLV